VFLVGIVEFELLAGGAAIDILLRHIDEDLRGFLDAFEVFAGSAPPTLRRSASIRSTTLPPAGRSFFGIGWPARFLLMRSTSAASYWSSNFSGSKRNR
jgi:hypothetical protein